MPTNDLSSDFAHFAAQSRYEDLPVEAIEGAKKSILDTIGVILAASGVEPAVRGVAELVRETGGSPESTVLGFGGRAPALMAAFANGAMAHCLDFDDHAPEGHHPSSSIVPQDCMLAMPSALMIRSASRPSTRHALAVAENTPITVVRCQSCFQPTLRRRRRNMSCPTATAVMRSRPEMPPRRSATASAAGTMELLG